MHGAAPHREQRAQSLGRQLRPIQDLDLHALPLQPGEPGGEAVRGQDVAGFGHQVARKQRSLDRRAERIPSRLRGVRFGRQHVQPFQGHATQWVRPGA